MLAMISILALGNLISSESGDVSTIAGGALAGIHASPQQALPGQSVTFYLPRGAIRIRVAGGGFQSETDLTGQSLATDTPSQTSVYRFTYWICTESGARRRTEVVPVTRLVGAFPRLATYWDWRRWRIDCVAGWNRYVTPQTDPANNGLIFFQPVEDSPERITVAIVPVRDLTASELMRQVLIEAPTQYDVMQEHYAKETTHGGLPAAWAEFSGLDRALAGIPTRSMVLAFVRDGRGYVISARAREAEFRAKEPLLRALVRSFAIDPRPAPRTNRASPSPPSPVSTTDRVGPVRQSPPKQPNRQSQAM